MNRFGMDYAVPGVMGGLGQGYVQPNMMYDAEFGKVIRKVYSAFGIDKNKKRRKNAAETGEFKEITPESQAYFNELMKDLINSEKDNNSNPNYDTIPTLY
jgi:hypothetical protein